MPPEPNEFSSEEDKSYYCSVVGNMMHVCSNAVNGCLDANGKCKRGYSSRTIIVETTLDDNGYPVYRRRYERDFKVVPHNREILLDWDGHINIEYAGTTFTVLYLYKYLFKGIIIIVLVKTAIFVLRLFVSNIQLSHTHDHNNMIETAIFELSLFVIETAIFVLSFFVTTIITHTII